MNLFHLHRKFCYIIQEIKDKFYFDNMVNVCSEEVWKMFLQRNFEVLTKEIKHIFIYIDPTGKKHNNYCDFIFCEKFFSQEVQKYICIQLLCIFVFVNAVAMFRIIKIVFYVQSFLQNLQMIKFFSKIFFLIDEMLVKIF